MDLVLLVDTSASILETDEENQVRISNFLISIVRAVDLDEVHIALVTFGSRVHVEFYLNTFSTQQEYTTAFKNYRFDRGLTMTGAALQVVRNDIFIHDHGDREWVPNTILLITDGKPTDLGQELTREVAEMKEEGVKIMIAAITTFGVPFDESMAELIASAPLKLHFFEVEDYNSLSVRLDEIILETCRTVNTSTVITTPNCKIFTKSLQIFFSSIIFVDLRYSGKLHSKLELYPARDSVHDEIGVRCDGEQCTWRK